MARKPEPPIVPSSGWAAWLTTAAAAAMSFLAVLALAAGIAAGNLAAEWRGAFEGTATVRLVGERDTMETRLAQAMEVLRQTPGIAAARPLTPEQQAALLTPWLGEAAGFADLPVPRLIDVTIAPPGPDVAALQSRLDLASDGAVYDDHDAWRQPLTRAATGLSRLAWVATALTVLAAAAMVALAARASLASHAEVVHVLRVIGAEDSFIAAAFTRRLSARAALGGLVGTALGLAALLSLPEVAVDRGLTEALLPGIAGWLGLLVAVPAVVALIAWATARRAVGRELERML